MNKTISSEWEEIHSSRSWGHYPSESVIRFVSRNYYNKEREKIQILDFGCGQGAHTWYLAREGFNTYAFDGSESAIKKTKAYLKESNLKAHLKAADGVQINYPSEFFDAVIDSACIYSNTFQNIKIMYKIVFDYLKPGGMIYTSSFSTGTTGYATGEELENNTFNGVKSGPLSGLGITHFWNKTELHDTLANVGFRDIVIESNNYTDCGNTIDMLIATAVKPSSK